MTIIHRTRQFNLISTNMSRTCHSNTPQQNRIVRVDLNRLSVMILRKAYFTHPQVTRTQSVPGEPNHSS